VTATVSPAAVRVIAESLRPRDRVLVTGAGGWFGLTLVALLEAAGATGMYVTRTARRLQAGSVEVDAVEWDDDTVQAFAPTLVIDCAFVLRDYVPDMSLERYVHDNTELTSRLLRTALLPSVRAIVSVSSGAAVHRADAVTRRLDIDPYGYIKRQTELAVLALARQHEKVTVIARPWSLSGTLVTRPDRYAFSNFIGQALAGGPIRVQAPHAVYRKYTAVDDFFAVCLAATTRGGEHVVDSAGELTEFGDLAGRVAERLGVTAERSTPTDTDVDDYYTRSTTWEDACAAANYRPASLDAQIDAVIGALRP
jgi:nucleoside-diphosphate-sugar epimerase